MKPWLDEEQILLGRALQDEIQQAIPLVKCATVFIGIPSIGDYQNWEIKSLFTQCVKRPMLLIPVLLPGVETIPEDLIFLDYKVSFRLNPPLVKVRLNLVSIW